MSDMILIDKLDVDLKNYKFMSSILIIRE